MKHDYSLAHLTALSLLAAGARRRRGAHRIPLRGAAHDARDARRGALRPRARQGADEGDQGAARRHRGRGPRHRALPHGSGARTGATSSRSSMRPPSSARTISSRSCPTPSASARPRGSRDCATSPSSATSSSAWNSRTGPRPAISPRRRAWCAPSTGATRESWSTCCTSGDRIRRSTSSRRCRASGSASRTSATPRRKCRRPMAGIIRTARDERQFPGEGGIDVRGILARMPQDIPYALEIPRVALTKAVGRRGGRAARAHAWRAAISTAAREPATTPRPRASRTRSAA